MWFQLLFFFISSLSQSSFVSLFATVPVRHRYNLPVFVSFLLLLRYLYYIYMLSGLFHGFATLLSQTYKLSPFKMRICCQVGFLLEEAVSSEQFCGVVVIVLYCLYRHLDPHQFNISIFRCITTSFSSSLVIL